MTTDAKTITKDTTELVFHLKTDKASPAGEPQNLFCQVVVTQDGEPIVHNLGTGQLRVDAPLPPKPNARPPPPPPPVAAAAARQARRAGPAAEKPLTRLEKLRLESQERAKAAAEPRRASDPTIDPTVTHRPTTRPTDDDPTAPTTAARTRRHDSRPGPSLAGLAARPPPRPRLAPAHGGPDQARGLPARLNLSTARDRQSFVVQATYADGITRDVTAEADDHPGQPGARPPRRDDLLPRRRRRDDAGRRLRRPDGRGAGQGRRRRPSTRRSASGST